MGGNIKPFSLARPLLRVERLLYIFKGVLAVASVAAGHSQCGQRHGKIRVELNRTLQMRNRRLVVELQMFALAHAELLQSIE